MQMRIGLFLLVIALYVVGCKKSTTTTPDVKKNDTIAGKIIPAINSNWGEGRDTAPLAEINGVINLSSRDKSYLIEKDGKLNVVIGRLKDNASLVLTFPYGRNMLKNQDQYAIPESGGEILFAANYPTPDNPYIYSSTQWGGGTARIKIVAMDADTIEGRFYGTLKSFEEKEKPIIIKNGWFRIGWNDNQEH